VCGRSMPRYTQRAQEGGRDADRRENEIKCAAMYCTVWYCTVYSMVRYLVSKGALLQLLVDLLHQLQTHNSAPTEQPEEENEGLL